MAGSISTHAALFDYAEGCVDGESYILMDATLKRDWGKYIKGDKFAIVILMFDRSQCVFCKDSDITPMHLAPELSKKRRSS